MTRPIPSGDRAAALRRTLGPVAWCALECLVERSDDGRTVEATVRLVAADLGVAKNTAHRALRALTHAGLVEAEQQRTEDGRFRSGRYRLHLDGLLDRAPPTGTASPTPACTGRCRRPAHPPARRLTMLPVTSQRRTDRDDRQVPAGGPGGPQCSA
ncbi:MAG: helix-turn-helix domain-containing protein [Acidimicrobiales bacterium]